MHRKMLKNRGCPAGILGAALVLLVSAAARADVGEPCCADLEARITQLETMAARRGNRQVALEVWGFVNEAAMYWNDGFEDNVYFVTNEDERSRVAFEIKADIAPKWSTGGLIEIGIRANRENRIDQDTPFFWSPPDVRYNYWFLQNEDLGRLSLGRNRMATYHIVEMMTANTFFFGKQGIGAWIGDNGGGFFLRKQDGTLTNGTNSLRWGDIDAHAPNASPGDGDRLEAVRYDTRDVSGFVFSTGYSGEGAADVALRYKDDIGDFKLAGGVGYGQYIGLNIRRCAVLVVGSESVNCHTFGMSGSVMHVPTGLYVYGAYGQQIDLNRRDLFQAPVDNVDRSFYVQAGIERKFIEAGRTTMFAEYQRDDIGAGVEPSNGGILNTTALGPAPLPPGDTSYNRMAKSEINTIGIGFNQHVEAAALNLYLAGRIFSADVFTSATGVEAGAVQTPIEDFVAVMGGAKLDF